jgi:hypothetical protein
MDIAVYASLNSINKDLREILRRAELQPEVIEKIIEEQKAKIGEALLVAKTTSQEVS